MNSIYSCILLEGFLNNRHHQQNIDTKSNELRLPAVSNHYHQMELLLTLQLSTAMK